jgi:CheY-like chemotaxis protein
MAAKDSILVVDDDEGVLTALEAELQDHYDVTAVGSAEQALAQLQIRAYSAIVSDVRMPGVDGLSLISQCAVRFPNMVRIILTAFDGDDVHETALGPHGAYKLVKPWGDDLIITLENALKQRKSNVELRRHLDLKSEMLDIDRRLHTKLSEDSLIHEAAVEMTRIPEVSAAATYDIDDLGTAVLLEEVLASEDGVVPELKKTRSSPIPFRNEFLYSVPIGDWNHPWGAVALRLSSAGSDVIRYLDFVGRQAARTLELIHLSRESIMPSDEDLDAESVSVDWLVGVLTTPVTVLASAPFNLRQLADSVRIFLPADEDLQRTFQEFQELTDDISNVTDKLTTLLNRLRSQKTFVDEAKPFPDDV